MAILFVLALIFSGTLKEKTGKRREKNAWVKKYYEAF
jgi:hypothetical protein